MKYYSEAIKLNEINATYYCNRAAAYLELAWYATPLDHALLVIIFTLLLANIKLFDCLILFVTAFKKQRRTAVRQYHLIRRLVYRLNDVQ